MREGKDQQNERKLKETQQAVNRLTQQNQSLQKAVETFKIKMTEYEGKLCSQTDTADVSSKKQQYEQQLRDKEVKDLKTQIDTLKKTKNPFEQKAAQASLKEQEAQTQMADLRRQMAEEGKNLEKVRLELQKSRDDTRRLEIDNKNYKDKFQATGCSCGLDKKVEDLNKQVSDLKLTQQVVVCHNQELGSYEYIGNPFNLNSTACRNI